MFTNLLGVVAIGLLAPLAFGFFPRVRLPAIVLEIVLGIVIGPSGLGWVKPDAAVSILALVGLAFLLFLSGLEIDVDRLHGRIVTLTALGFALSFVIAILIGIALRAGGLVKSPLFVAIVLAATSLGVVFPVLKDSRIIDSSLGQLVIAAASIAEFGSIILLSLFFSGKSSTSTSGRLILLGVFGLVVVLVGVGIASAKQSMSLSRVLRRLQDTTAQIRVRAAFLLMIGFTALADRVGLETILGAFAAGALLSLLDRDETTHPQFRVKLQAAGFGVFIPIFFVTSGLRFNLSALFASGSTIARVPLFLLAILLARGLPALVYIRTLGLSRSLIAGILQATTLPFIVAATQIGLQLGVVSRASAAALVAAGLLSVVICPAFGLVLLRRDHPQTAAPRALPSPGMPVLTAEDRALCCANDVDAAATPPLTAYNGRSRPQHLLTRRAETAPAKRADPAPGSRIEQRGRAIRRAGPSHLAIRLREAGPFDARLLPAGPSAGDRAGDRARHRHRPLSRWLGEA